LRGETRSTDMLARVGLAHLDQKTAARQAVCNNAGGDVAGASVARGMVTLVPVIRPHTWKRQVL
jgi:hypothetical protein